MAAVLLMALSLCGAPVAAATVASVAPRPPLECTSAAEQPLWPTFHLMNNVSRGSDGRLQMEGLNDCNGVLEYRGLYHQFVQGGLGRSGMVGSCE
jgi:hypothetical protein